LRITLISDLHGENLKINTTHRRSKQRRRDSLTSSLTDSSITALRHYADLTLLTTEIVIVTQSIHVPAAICANREILKLPYAILG